MRPFLSIPIPARLESRRRDARGYPIPWLTQCDREGVPDFRVTDARKVKQAQAMRLCAMCGEPMGRHLALIGGPISHQTRLFTDPPMHKDCALYAVQVCPFLAAPKMRYAETLRLPAGVLAAKVVAEVDDKRPEVFFVATTKSVARVRLPSGEVVMQAAPWESVEWWRHGVFCDAEAAGTSAL